METLEPLKIDEADEVAGVEATEAGKSGRQEHAAGAQRKRRFWFRPLRTVRLVFLVAALCALVGVSGFFAGRFGGGSEKITQLDAVILENRLEEISELASVSWSYTNMAQFENKNVFYGMTLPFTTKKFILTYDGEIKVGVDLRKAAVDISGTEIHIRLPQAEILSHEIDENSVEVFDEKSSIFNPFTVEDFTAFQSDQKAAMEKKAVEKGLLKEGREKAADSVHLLLGAALPEGYALSID
ncbi:DUF4230 domain-containing protein [Oscillibacter sp.]|uniref:DUF4230 domain-containing protein n=1 Tax=Oscillibacter sp. TaxID=1945593 RepID=UPI0028B16F2C|nr:DUF4230 domain-containing protein [Oscillibacter sp.]